MKSAIFSIAASEIQRLWPAIEADLISAQALPNFKTFLSNYRGLPPTDYAYLRSDSALTEQVGQLYEKCVFQIQRGLNSAYQKACQQLCSAGLERADSASSSIFFELLNCFEEVLNLAIWLWRGGGDENFQFRTIVDYCDWNCSSKTISLASYQLNENSSLDVFMCFTPSGVLLRQQPETGYVRRASIKYLTWQEGATPGAENHWDSAKAFAFVRWLQSFTCQLTDDWEYENSILAVEFANARKNLSGLGAKAHNSLLLEVTGRMNDFRNAYSAWFVEGLTEFQSALYWISKNFAKENDVLLEVEAAQTLLLAAMQKLFLPASVSRHKYGKQTLQNWKIWLEQRCEYFPEDFSAQLLLQSLNLGEITLSLSSDWMTEFLEKKNFSWYFSFDTSAGLKAFCWRLKEQDHLLLCALFGIAMSKKLRPSPLGDYWLNNWLSLLQMPNTYISEKVGLTMAGEEVTKVFSHEWEKQDNLYQKVSLLLKEVLDLEGQRGADKETLACIASAFFSLDKNGVLLGFS